MSISPRPRFRELDTVRDRIDRLLTETGLLHGLQQDAALMPDIDVQETDDKILVKASMPGIKPEDIDINIDQNVLTIRGTSREEHEETEGTWHVHERRCGRMFRSVTLPAAVNDDAAEARMSDGVLEIQLPKSEATIGKRIKVTSS